MDVTIVVPCYRSRETLPLLLERIQVVLGADDSPVSRYEVILVVDGSPDDTASVALDLQRRMPHVRVLTLRRNYGQHNALLAGILRGRYPVTVTMDDDLQHRPEALAAMLAPLEDSAVDLVYGIAADEEHGVLRSLASRTVKLSLAASGVPNARDVSALRAFRTELREGFEHVADPFASVDVMLSWATSGVRRVDVPMDKRVHGRSSYSLRALVRHAFSMVTGYSAVPLKFVTWLGMVCALLGAVLLVRVLIGFLTGSTTVAGFTTLASMIALFSGAQMLSIGILGEYVGRMHFRSMQRPPFLVRTDSHDGQHQVTESRERA
ncbi:MAG: glycosyltransferase family 2 protein [Nocardioidaceae bacterium]